MTRYRLSLDERPRPLQDAASRIRLTLGILGTITSALVGFGVLSVVQGDALTGLWGALLGLVTPVFVILAAFGVVRAGEPQVTPLSDPRDNDGNKLTP